MLKNKLESLNGISEGGFVQRSGDVLEDVLQELESVLLPHGCELGMSFTNQVFKHGWGDAFLVWNSWGLLGADDMRIGVGVSTGDQAVC